MRTFLRRAAGKAAHNLAQAGIWRDSQDTLVRDASDYWDDPASKQFTKNSHWCRDTGITDETWGELGKPHLLLFQKHLNHRRTEGVLDRIIEWGCGGGANAIHFVSHTRDFVGVDVSSASLVECKLRLEQKGFHNFSPVHIDLVEPEKAVLHLLGTCDMLLCTYVFELLPSPEYGTRILKLAYELLRPGGFALIQIKYQTHERRTRPRRWMYQRNLANMTTYPIDAFWESAEQIGFIPSSISLLPKDPLVDDERYAYFLLDKHSNSSFASRET